jgi:hypothetical protein
MTLTANTSLISHIGSTVLLTLFLILILGIAVCAILSFVPRRPYLDRASGMIVQSFLILSSPLHFPLNRIQIKDMPEGLMEHLSVINHGCLNIFGIYSGTFRSTRDKAPVYIYLRNRRHGLVYFEYDGRRYVLNPWK